MSELDERCLDAFPRWLSHLAEDVRNVLGLIGRAELPEPVRTRLAGALNYSIKSFDLISDGIEDLGFLDDAMVLRVAARQAAAECGADVPDPLARLGAEAALIEEFLGPTYPALDAYVVELPVLVVRGRAGDAIVRDELVREEFGAELRSWAEAYTAPSFARDGKNLIKLRSFLTTRLAG